MKRKLLLAALFVAGALGMRAQTDVTKQYLLNPSFELAAEGVGLTQKLQASNAALSMYGWTQDLNGITDYNNTEIIDNNTIGTNSNHKNAIIAAEGNYHLFFRRSWNGSNQKDVVFTTNTSMYPAGHYTVSYSYILEEGFSTDKEENKKTGSNLKVKAMKGEEVFATSGQINAHNYGDISASNKQVFTDDWAISTFSFDILQEDTEIALAFVLAPRGGNKTEFHLDNVKIYYQPFATTDDYDALQTAIDNAKSRKESISDDVTLGFEVGEYAPYNMSELLLTQAEEINIEENNLQSFIQNLTNQLNAAWVKNVEEVNAVYDGTFATAEPDGAPLGWRMSNNSLGGTQHSRAFVGDVRLSGFGNESNSGFFMRFDGTNSNQGSMYYYGDTDGDEYTMPLKADTYYTVSVDFTNWGTTASKPLRLNVTGPEGFAMQKDGYSTKNAEKSTSTPDNITITFKTTAAGNYVISFQSPGNGSEHNVVVSNIVLKKAMIAVSEDADYNNKQEGTAHVTLNRTIKAGLNTVVLPFDLTQEEVESAFGEGSKVYTVNDEKSTPELIHFVTADGIKANAPVVLDAAKEGSEYTFENVTLVAGEPETTGSTVSFIGSYKATTTLAQDENIYVLSNDKLFYVDSDVTMKGTRAYFQVAGANPVKGVGVVFDGEATGIESINANNTSNAAAIYDLSGRVVKNPARGIYIVDGKKVMIK